MSGCQFPFWELNSVLFQPTPAGLLLFGIHQLDIGKCKIMNILAFGDDSPQICCRSSF